MLTDIDADPLHIQQIDNIHQSLAPLLSAAPFAIREDQFDNPRRFIQADPDQMNFELLRLSHWYLQFQLNKTNRGRSLPARVPANFGPDTQYSMIIFGDFTDGWSLERDEVMRIYSDRRNGSIYNPAYDLEQTCLMTVGYNIGVATNGLGETGLGVNLAQVQAADYNSEKDFRRWMGGIRPRSIALHIAEQIALAFYNHGYDQMRYATVTQEMSGDRERDEAKRRRWMLECENYSDAGFFFIPYNSPVSPSHLSDNSLQGLVFYKDVVAAVEHGCLAVDCRFQEALSQRLNFRP